MLSNGMPSINLKLWNDFINREYHARIADIDGNLTCTGARHEDNLSQNVIDIICDKVNRNVPFGISTARSLRKDGLLDNIRKTVINKISPTKISNFILFINSGVEAIWYEKKDYGIIEKRLDLVKFFGVCSDDIVSRQEISEQIHNRLAKIYQSNVIEFKSDKPYGFQIKILDVDVDKNICNCLYVAELVNKSNQILREFFPEYEAYSTRSTIYIAKIGVNKGLSLRFMALLYDINIEAIIGTDDQGHETGVGWHLIKHRAGISTNYCSESFENTINLPAICGKTGLDAWLYLNDFIKYTPAGKKIKTIEHPCLQSVVIV